MAHVLRREVPWSKRFVLPKILEREVELPRVNPFQVRPKRSIPISITGSVTAGSTLTRKISFPFDVYIKNLWICFARNQKRNLRVYLKIGPHGTSDDPNLIESSDTNATEYFVGDGEVVPLLDINELLKENRFFTVYADNQGVFDYTLDVKGTVREV